MTLWAEVLLLLDEDGEAEADGAARMMPWLVTAPDVGPEGAAVLVTVLEMMEETMRGPRVCTAAEMVDVGRSTGSGAAASRSFSEEESSMGRDRR